MEELQIFARFGRWDENALEALGRFNGVNHQFRYHVYSSRAGYERSLMDHYADEPKLFHSYIRHKKRGIVAVGPLKRPCGPCEWLL